MSETGQALGSDVAIGDMPIGVQHFIKAGCHFGHQTKRWNPKMRPVIYGARNGIHIIDLDQTAQLFRRAYNFIVEAVGRGGHVLFVGTKRQAQDIIQEEATRAKRAPLPEGIMDIDESGIGGSSTEQENAYTSAYFWSTRRTRQRYQETTSTLTVAFEPAPSWDTVKQKNRRKKA